MSPRAHPFDAYAPFTDVAALKAASGRPLRKSVRVNTRKMSVEAFRAHAAKRGWTLTPVPWCPEAFFVDREDRSEALGRDLLHLLGFFYMQEAASMLPPELLQPGPGHAVLDMSAAPGSKTTQMGARMGSRGVIIANDVQEKRLWTLKHALYRSGVQNVVVTKKVGQWFAKHMTERFDLVLCDAPCTAQGTARKDSDALLYCSPQNVAKMEQLQRELLEAALHAAVIGGRVVYSTCTLTPEENEGVVLSMLNKFGDQVELIDPRTLGIAPEGTWDRAIEDSLRLQEAVGIEGKLPLLRLWPQVYDTEGFFCAVFRKIRPTRHAEPMDRVPLVEKPLPLARQEVFAAELERRYGVPFIEEGELLLERGDELLLTTIEAADFPLTLHDYAVGIPFGKRVDDKAPRLSQEMVSLRGNGATRGVRDLSDDEAKTILSGQDIDRNDDALIGDVILRWNGVALGTGVVSGDRLKNRLSRWMIRRT